MKKDVYQIVTDRIIELLESGVNPWHKSWKTGHSSTAPTNHKSKSQYRGINHFLLSCAPYKSPFWLTFKQAKELGGKVRKGQKAWPVIFWNWVLIDEAGNRTKDPEKAKRKVPFLRYYNVFNVEQIDGLNIKSPEPPELTDHQRIQACEKVISGYKNAPKITTAGEQPCYIPSSDEVRMPEMGLFDTPEIYYSIAFHELAHSTGHQSRLNRDGITKKAAFGDSIYSKEELVAEMTAAFLSAHCSIDGDTLDDSASYLQSWIKVLKGDSKLVVNAAAAAQKASDHILGVTPKQTTTDGE